jgi:O-glycosyl hydrolase
LADPDAMQYVGLVSYHSWNGGTDEQLIAWRDHARRANVPLTVAEAGTDPDAHQYRNIVAEPWYALEEIENYLRCMNLSQPASLLHWQLTPDYGFLTPEMQPTRRWWQFKQLADLSLAKSRYLPAKCDRSDITVVALGDQDGATVIHVGNTGAARAMKVHGLPSTSTKFRVFITDASHEMKQVDPIETQNGRAEINLPAQSFMTLTR